MQTNQHTKTVESEAVYKKANEISFTNMMKTHQSWMRLSFNEPISIWITRKVDIELEISESLYHQVSAEKILNQGNNKILLELNSVILLLIILYETQKMLNWLREKVSSRESLGSSVPSALPGTEAGHSSYDSLSKGTSTTSIN